MLLVGNVGVNHVRADCLDFGNIRTLEQPVYQRTGGFIGALKEYFYQQARPQDIRLAERVINGEPCHPATRAL